ncbi:MAG: hypothetical protein Q4Q53_00020 [Methanocorpusculum sp.]|nr:hypothetical protein [Methanocorpusculum sp.]
MKRTKIKSVIILMIILSAVFIGTASADVNIQFEPAAGFNYLSTLGGNHYWINENSDAELIINASSGGTESISAYNITITNLSNPVNQFDGNIIYSTAAVPSNWQGIQNGNLFAASRNGGAVFENNADLAKFVLRSGESSAGAAVSYTVSVSGKASVASANAGTVDSYSTVNIIQNSFTFYILKKPSITGFRFYGQSAVENPLSVIYLYKENPNYVVALTADENLDENIHKINWAASGAVSVSDSENSVGTVTVNDIGSGTLTVSVKEISDTDAEISVIAQNWKSSVSDNRDTAAENDGTDNSGWNFNTERVITYNVKPGPTRFNSTGNENILWDSHVPAANLTGNTKSVSDWEYILTETHVGFTDYAVCVNAENNFTVFQSSADGTENDAVIKLTGFRLGDVNKKDGVEITDSAIIGMITVSLINPANEEFIYADCNKKGGDGIVNVADILAVNKYIVDLKPWQIS